MLLTTALNAAVQIFGNGATTGAAAGLPLAQPAVTTLAQPGASAPASAVTPNIFGGTVAASVVDTTPARRSDQQNHGAVDSTPQRRSDQNAGTGSSVDAQDQTAPSHLTGV